MKIKKILSTFVFICFLLIMNILGNADIVTVSAAENKIIVEKEGVIVEYATIEEAINSVSDQETATITIPAGTYNETVSITNTKNSKNRTIILKGAQAGNSAVVNGQQRNGSETILTEGIEIRGLHEDDSIIIDGFTLNKKGIDIQGWGNTIDSTGEIKIMNNVITDVENGSVSAIHVSASASEEFIDTLEISNNYIANIGAAGFATNGIYITLTIAALKINDNVIRDVNHSCIQFESAIISTEAEITGNDIANWNHDDAGGSGSIGSNGDGIYITKTNTPNTVPIAINHNRITRDEALGGAKGYAVRCGYNKGLINLNENYWGTDFPLSVISGGEYKNVTLSLICDEALIVKNQSISKFTVSTNDLYASGTTNEKKLTSSITMLDKTVDAPVPSFSTDTPEIITLETRDGSVYYAAKKVGKANIIATVVDPVSNEEFKIEKSLLVKDMELSSQIIEPNESVQMAYKILPVDEAIPSYYKMTWTSSDETVADVDENGLVSNKGSEGTAQITLTVKLGSTIYYQATATVTVKNPTINTAPIINAENKTLTVGDAFDPLQGVTAMDLEDGDISENIEVIKNEVDMSNPGTYEVTYKVTDSENEWVEKTITVTVMDKEKVSVTIMAMIEGSADMKLAETQYTKGYVLENDKLAEIQAMREQVEQSEVMKAYQFRGFYFDKEGKNELKLGHAFNENTVIYLIWDAKQENPDVKPKDPIDSEKPTNPDIKADETENVIKNAGADTGYHKAYSIYAALLALSGIAIAVLKNEKERN